MMTTTESSDGKVKYSFGVGCFHFQAIKELTQNSIEHYKVLLEEYLNRDNLIKEISFYKFNENENIGEYIVKNKSAYADIDDLIFLYPKIDRGTIRFKITIPKRLQSEYLGDFLKPLDSEEFTVDIVFSSGFPITFVKTSKIETSPSTAVVILWKHIRKNWIDSEYIQFCMIGPSPFHSDFFVYGSEKQKFRIEHLPEYGYDEVNIYAPNAAQGATIEDIIQYRLKEDLSLFYNVVSMRNSLNNKFYGLTQEIENNLDSEINSSGNSYIFRRTKIDAYLSLVRLEKIDAEIQSIERFFRRERESIRQKFGDSALEAVTASEIDEIKDTPIQQYKNILSTLKDRTSTRLTNKGAIISALLGVILGFGLQELGSSLKSSSATKNEKAVVEDNDTNR